MGEKGNSQIFTLPVREHLQAVADSADVWRSANIFMGAAAIAAVAALTMLTTILEGAGERVFSRLGLVGWLVATVLWTIFSAFRAVISVSAAQEMVAIGTVPPYYEPLAQWGFALFYIYAVVGFLAMAAYGGSLLQVDLVPAWAGWATIVFSMACWLCCSSQATRYRPSITFHRCLLASFYSCEGRGKHQSRPNNGLALGSMECLAVLYVPILGALTATCVTSV